MAELKPFSTGKLAQLEVLQVLETEAGNFLRTIEEEWGTLMHATQIHVGIDQPVAWFLPTFAKVLCGGGKFKITKQGHASFFHNGRNEISA